MDQGTPKTMTARATRGTLNCPQPLSTQAQTTCAPRYTIAHQIMAMAIRAHLTYISFCLSVNGRVSSTIILTLILLTSMLRTVMQFRYMDIVHDNFAAAVIILSISNLSQVGGYETCILQQFFLPTASSFDRNLMRIFIVGSS